MYMCVCGCVYICRYIIASQVLSHVLDFIRDIYQRYMKSHFNRSNIYFEHICNQG